MKLLKIFICALFLTGFVCRSGNTVKNAPPTATQAPDTTIIPVSAPAPSPVPAPAQQSPTALKPNATRVIGILQSTEETDSLRFRVTIRIDSAFAIGDMESLIGSGQNVVATPRFLRDENESVDTLNVRNRRMLTLRHKPAGTPFSGKLSMQSPGFWTIIEVDSL